MLASAVPGTQQANILIHANNPVNNESRYEQKIRDFISMCLTQNFKKQFWRDLKLNIWANDI